ncbi:MAG: Nif3-like dinuclear metal center hexameric protein [Saprospiraceae bacterium]|nr:Nif3-like dinuclear metal center hexameric protein [Saprospiraceae bacterium]
MKIRDVLNYLEQIAPPEYQESYDNAGLITGDANTEVSGVICCLDSTEAVVDEAIAKGCNLILAHHPIIFKGLRSLTGNNYVERTIIKAIRENIAIYAIHTNLDNVYQHGVNQRFAETLGLLDTQILAPKQNLQRLTARIKSDEAEKLRAALEVRRLDHLHLEWSMQGDWTSIAIHFNYSAAQHSAIVDVLEDVTGRTVPLSSWNVRESDPLVGAGMIGVLPKALSEKQFLEIVRDRMKTGCIRHTNLLNKKIHKVALCGGAGGFLLSHAIRAGADAFITADYKYHEFFDADGRILLADIGHFESEQYTIDLLQELISRKFSNFAAYCTQVRTNPVQYLV